MAASTSNGEAELSFAEQLKSKHTETHNVTIEDTIDEEDVQHPPPSMVKHSSDLVKEDAKEVDVPLSEKSKGKQKAPMDGEKDTSFQSTPKASGLDTKSEELFPALGGGPKPRLAQTPVAWGSKKPAALANGASGGVNGNSTPKSAIPHAPSPTSGSGARPSNAPIPSRGVAMPGRFTDKIMFQTHQMLPRNQLKKPLHDILRDINKKSKAGVEMSVGNGYTFEGNGPTAESVRQALRDIAKEVGLKQNLKMNVPASVRAHIIGRQGASVRNLSETTGARIRVQRGEDGPQQFDDDDDSATVEVIIEGDPIATQLAQLAIDKIVRERTSRMNIRMRDVPAEFFPFLAGPNDSAVRAFSAGQDVDITIPKYYSWSQQPPSQSPAHFTPHPSCHIQISGDRNVVDAAKASIERQVKALTQQLALQQLRINRGQHQFILGNRSSPIDDLLRETGCSVILPPDSDDTDKLIVIGPRDKIEQGVEKVMDLATSMRQFPIDIARQRNDASGDGQAYARALNKYLQQEQALAQLEKLHDVRIVSPPSNNGPVTWELFSRDGRTELKAKSDILNLIEAHPPSRLRNVELDPFFHQHVLENHSQRLRQAHGIQMLFPEEVEDSREVLLVFTGPESEGGVSELPTQAPSQKEVAEFQRALAEMEEELFGITALQQSIGTQPVEAPPKFHDKIRKFVRREQQDLPNDVLPIQLVSNSSLPSAGKVSFSEPAGLEQQLFLRGPDERLGSFIDKIVQFVEAEKRDELERGFTMSFDFPQKYANILIGKKGENINKLREEFDVDIQVGDGKVELKGPKAKAENAKSRILAMAKKLEDEATLTLKIAPQYHRDLIGAKGSLVNKLQDRYNVRIQFPRTAQNGHDDDSVVDGGDTGGPRHGKSKQAPDEVIVRGPKKGADSTREEILNLLQWNMDNSHTAVVSVAQSQLPSLIGQGGREMDKVREDTGARIEVPGSRETADASGRVEIKIKGTKKQVDDAKKLLEPRVKVFDESITKSVNVDKKYHRDLIGTGGANIRSIVVAAGGSDDKRELAKTVRFPRPESNDTEIRVEGSKELVEKVATAIQEFVSQRENRVTEIVEVAPEKHRLLIGHGGETRRTLESELGVTIDIPRQSVQGAARSQVKLIGSSDKIPAAKERILSIVKEQEGETIQVPKALHHAISDNGQFFRRLRSDYKVTVDHAGNQPPQKPAAKPATRSTGGTSMPLITDDESPADNNYSWEVVDTNPSTGVEGEIPWILRGSPDQVARAKAALQKALDQASEQSSTGYLILPDPKTYRLVIGTGGSQINTIRKETGCRINVPRDQAKGEAIELIGSKEGVEKGKDIILELVKDAGNGRRRS